MDGLIVLQPYANQIINGKKTKEYRTKMPPKDKMMTPLFLLSKGVVLGKIIITSAFASSKRFCLWNIRVLDVFETPIKYEHTGQQVWVKNVDLILNMNSHISKS